MAHPTLPQDPAEARPATPPDLGALFSPRKVAIIGASENNIYAMGLIRRIQQGADTQLIGVNPNHREVGGIPCVASISQLPDDVDAAFVAVSAARVMPALRECDEAGIRAAVVVAAGFADSQVAADRDRQQQLTRFGAATGMAICGPSCLGIANVKDRRYIFGSTAAGPINTGRIGLISQSGGTVSALVRAAVRRGLGFSYLVSSGTEACLDVCDYLEYLLDDESTEVICLFLERLTDSERFIRLSQRAATAGKALLCIKIGHSAQGARAAIGHTGALTGSDTFYDTMFTETGVQRCWSVEEMMDRAALLAQSGRVHWPAGNRIGIVTVSGGTGTILADLCSRYGLNVPTLNPEDAKSLSADFPDRVRVENPIDVSAQVQRELPQLWGASVQALASSANIDAVLVADLHPQSAERLEILDGIRDHTGTPVALTPVSDGFDLLDGAARDEARHRSIPIFTGGEPAVRALSAAANVAAGRERLLRHSAAWWAGDATPVDGAGLAATAEQAARLTRNEVAVRRALAGAGAGVPREECFTTLEALTTGLAGFAYPVAVKICDDRVVHKAAAGMMRLGVQDADAAAEVARQLWDEFANAHGGGEPQGVLVQEIVAGGRYELYVSTLCDAGNRPVVTVGQGGASVEAAADVSRRLAPVTPIEAIEMFAELRSARRMQGADLDAAARAVSAIANLALVLRDSIRTLEFNPIIVRAEGCGAFVVDTVVEPIAINPGGSR